MDIFNEKFNFEGSNITNYIVYGQSFLAQLQALDFPRCVASKVTKLKLL